jgi:exocyst complex component 4
MMLSSLSCSSSFDLHDEDGALDLQDDTLTRVNGGDSALKDVKIVSHHVPRWLSESTPDEFLV